MNTYTISKADMLGDPDPKYGQIWYCETQEQLEPIMFNLMSGSVNPGDTVTCEEVLLKTSKKGNEYHRLKKVKVIPGEQVTASESSVSVTREAGGMNRTPPVSESQINQILELVKENNEMLKKLTYIPSDDMPEGFLVGDSDG